MVAPIIFHLSFDTFDLLFSSPAGREVRGEGAKHRKRKKNCKCSVLARPLPQLSPRGRGSL